jgi:hypothetical protein
VRDRSCEILIEQIFTKLKRLLREAARFVEKNAPRFLITDHPHCFTVSDCANDF